MSLGVTLIMIQGVVVLRATWPTLGTQAQNKKMKENHLPPPPSFLPPPQKKKIFWEMEPFTSPWDNFLYFRKRKPWKNFLYFLQESCSYISVYGKPEKVFYISRNGSPVKTSYISGSYFQSSRYEKTYS